MPFVKLTKVTVNTDHIIAIRPVQVIKPGSLDPTACKLYLEGRLAILITETEAAYLESILDANDSYSEAATSEPLTLKLTAPQIADKVAQLLRDFYPSGIGLDGLRDYFRGNSTFAPFVETVELAVDKLKAERVAVQRGELIYHASHDPQRNHLDLTEQGLTVAESDKLNEILQELDPNW